MQPLPRVGCVRYLNARPLVHGWRGAVRFDHPSVLCRQLAAGELDVALVSSFEYLRNPIYAIVDEVAIASDGPVFSVILAHRLPVAELKEVVVDPASTTSVNLLRCLLGERGIKVDFLEDGDSCGARGRLFIGDQAIHFREQFGDHFHYLDLGAEWKARTNLPFVYALWLIRPEYPARREVARALRALALTNLANLEAVIAEEPEERRAFCNYYLRQCLRFSLGKKEKQGFQKFAELCVAQNLLPALPPPLLLA